MSNSEPKSSNPKPSEVWPTPLASAPGQPEIAARHAQQRGEYLRQLTNTIASALVAEGHTIDSYDKATICAALCRVVYPSQPVDLPSWVRA